MGPENNVRFPIYGPFVWCRIRNLLKWPVLQSERTVVARQRRSMCCLSCEWTSNENWWFRPDWPVPDGWTKGILGLLDGWSLLAQGSNNIRLRGQRPRSDRWRWFEPKWRPILQHRGCVWLTAVSQIRRWLGGHRVLYVLNKTAKCPWYKKQGGRVLLCPELAVQ